MKIQEWEPKSPGAALLGSVLNALLCMVIGFVPAWGLPVYCPGGGVACYDVCECTSPACDGNNQPCCLGGPGGPCALAYVVTLTVNPTNVALGGVATIRASISGGPSPTGIVFVEVDSAIVSPPVYVIDGVAALEQVFEVSGTHVVTVSYMGDANGSGGISNPVSLTVSHSPAAVGFNQSVFGLGNYPNPFNPRTVIAFDLPEVTRVDLRVYDLGGRLVRTLFAHQMIAPGHHDVDWDGRDEKGEEMSAGVYMYRLEAGDYVEARRMVLVK